MKLAYSLWKPETPESSIDSGNASGTDIPKILLLHGMGGTGALWRPIAASLEDRYAVLAPDQRGHGKSLLSSPDATYTPQDYGQDIVETLDELDFHPTWIVGHSMGVRSACATAHLKPDWVQGLILVDLGFSGPAGGGLGDGLAQFLKMLPHEFESRSQARLFMQANCPDQSIAQYLMAVSVQTPEGAIRFPFDQPALIKTIESVRDTSVRDWIQQLASRGMPILVLRGAESGVWSHEEFEKERAHFKASPTVVFEEFPGAGHGLPFEKRREFVERITAFMQAS
jgi:esterase